MKTYPKKHIITLLTTALIFVSCIKNDIPYPTVYGNFLNFEVKEQTAAARIDTKTLTVILTIADTADLSRITLVDYKLTDDTQITPEPGQTIDLTTPVTFQLTTWQKYTWTVKAVQPIARAFTIADQIDTAIIDPAKFSALAYVPSTVSLKNITVNELKLGPSNSVITPDPATVHDFTQPQIFEVKYRNTVEQWRVIVLQTTKLVTTKTPDAFATLAYLKGSGKAGADNGFEYRKTADAAWTKVNPADVISQGGSFSARLTGLQPETDYTYRAYSGTNKGTEIAFTTEPTTPLPNPSFDNWHQNGKVWNPWAEAGTSFWDTGNRGATTLGESNTTPTDDIATPAGKAAKLESRFIGLAGIGKFAAGNIFAGEYVATDGTNGILSFGRPYTSRPLKLKGKFKYTGTKINYTSSKDPNLSYLNGTPDSCHIYIALSDASAPYEIKTKPAERKLFDKNDQSVIAYGELVNGAHIGTYTEFTIELNYRATDRKPKYIVVVGTASKYGDYFTGGTESTLWLDDLQLVFE